MDISKYKNLSIEESEQLWESDQVYMVLPINRSMGIPLEDWPAFFVAGNEESLVNALANMTDDLDYAVYLVDRYLNRSDWYETEFHLSFAFVDSAFYFNNGGIKYLSDKIVSARGKEAEILFIEAGELLDEDYLDSVVNEFVFYLYDFFKSRVAPINDELVSRRVKDIHDTYVTMVEEARTAYPYESAEGALIDEFLKKLDFSSSLNSTEYCVEELLKAHGLIENNLNNGGSKNDNK